MESHNQAEAQPLSQQQLQRLLSFQSLKKSQVMHLIFTFLNKGHVLQLQITCKFWYQSLVPQSLYNDIKIGQKAMFLEVYPQASTVSELHLDHHFREGQYAPSEQGAGEAKTGVLKTQEYRLRIDESQDVELQKGLIVLSETIAGPKVINTDETAPSKYFLIGGW